MASAHDKILIIRQPKVHWSNIPQDCPFQIPRENVRGHQPEAKRKRVFIELELETCMCQFCLLRLGVSIA
jgi:hypothetical protein